MLSRLREWASLHPSRPCLSYFPSVPMKRPKSPPVVHTYSSLLSASEALSGALRDNGCVLGDRVLLVYTPGPQFVVAFLACLKIDAIAVPVFPPDPTSKKVDFSVFTKIVSDSGAKLACCNTEYERGMMIGKIKGGGLPKLPGLSWLNTDTVKAGKAASTSPDDEERRLLAGAAAGPGQPVAFLQYTSGSTSSPKGVRITHASLSHNLRAISDALKVSESTVCCSWLPQYHDMGLIGSYLGLIYCGGSGYYTSPLTFIKDPPCILRLISWYGGTHIQMPNFAYRLLARRVQQCKKFNLDLSTLAHSINAAEPVDHRTILNFFESFEPMGLNRSCISVTYGLAENTVFVCEGGRSVAYLRFVDEQVVEIEKVVGIGEDVVAGGSIGCVSCGFVGVGNGIEVAVVKEGRRVDDRTIGEVYVKGGSVADGYWNVKSEESFKASVVGDQDLWLKTGDLAFLHQGQLYITGREKDLIIVRGRNYYPQDIEGTVEGLGGGIFRPGCCACFSMTQSQGGGGGEGDLVAVCVEVRDEKNLGGNNGGAKGVVKLVREAVVARHGLSLAHVVLLKPRTIPKTTSGKIARSLCKRKFKGGELAVIKEGHGDFESLVSASGCEVDALGGEGGETAGGGGENQEEEAPIDPEKVAEVRGLSREELQQRVIQHASQISSMPPNEIDVSAPFTTFMDSMSISQFKGLLESTYYVTLSDGYLFRDDVNLTKIIESIKSGRPEDDDDGQDGAVAGGSLDQPMISPPGLCCSVM